jgi:hypothetical protein
MQVTDAKVLLGRARAAGTTWMWVSAAVSLTVGFLDAYALPSEILHELREQDC